MTVTDSFFLENDVDEVRHVGDVDLSVAVYIGCVLVKIIIGVVICVAFQDVVDEQRHVGHVDLLVVIDVPYGIGQVEPTAFPLEGAAGVGAEVKAGGCVNDTGLTFSTHSLAGRNKGEFTVSVIHSVIQRPHG